MKPRTLLTALACLATGVSSPDLAQAGITVNVKVDQQSGIDADKIFFWLHGEWQGLSGVQADTDYRLADTSTFTMLAKTLASFSKLANGSFSFL